MSDKNPIIPKKTSEMITLLELIDLAILSATENPPAIIIRRITRRLKDDDHNDNLLLSLLYSCVFRYSPSSHIPLSFSGSVSDHIRELR